MPREETTCSKQYDLLLHPSNCATIQCGRGCVYGIPLTMTGTVSNSVSGNAEQVCSTGQLPIETSSAATNCWRVTLEMRAKTRVCIYVKCPSRFSDANKDLGSRHFFFVKFSDMSPYGKLQRDVPEARSYTRERRLLALPCPSVCLSAGTAPTGHIFVIFHIGDFYDNPSRKTKFA
jgi:hypothetical protein